MVFRYFASVFLLLPVVACESSGQGQPVVAFAPVVMVELTHDFDEPPIAVGLGAVTRLASGAFVQHFVVSGAQTGQSPTIELASSAFLASVEGELVSITESDSRRIDLPFGATVEIQVTVPAEVASARPHPVFRIVIPVWLDGHDLAPLAGSVAISIVFRGNGEPLPDVRPFCEVAVPSVDGRVPSPEDKERMEELALQLLPNNTATELRQAMADLRRELRPGAGGYTTAEVVEIVGAVCNASLRAIASAP